MRKNSASEKIGDGESGVVFPRSDQKIPFLGGRPERESGIDADDYINLLIALYTCKSLEDFFLHT